MSIIFLIFDQIFYILIDAIDILQKICNKNQILTGHDQMLFQAKIYDSHQTIASWTLHWCQEKNFQKL